MPSLSLRTVLAPALIASCCFLALHAAAPREDAPPRWRQHDVKRPKPPVVEPADGPIARKPPKDAVVLFDGSNLDAWKSPGGGDAKWKIADGAMQTVPGAGAIRTKKSFGDMQLHIEWAAPNPPRGKGQDRGNSGVFLMNQFEIQVLDSYRAETYADGQAGAIYGQYPPLANASRPPGEWQSYDIAFRRPRFDGSGQLVEPARITVFHNGILIQNNEEPFGPTFWLKWAPYDGKDGDRGPISLQDHDHPVSYRNIWLREIPERPAPTAEALARPKSVALPSETLNRYVGRYRMGGTTVVAVAREENHLTVKFPFLPQPLRLEPMSETEFDVPTTDAKFTFRTGDGGKVTGAHFQIGDGDRELTKVGP